MADKRAPLVKGITPKGLSVWPKLNKPDEYQGKKSYSVKLVLSSEDAAELINKIDTAISASEVDTRAKLEDAIKNGKTGDVKAKAKKALAALVTATPYADEVDDDGEPTGNVVFKFKANAEYKDKKTDQLKPITIPLFDSKGQPTKASIWGGSIIRVAYELVPYFVASSNTCGVSLRISGVKIIELVSGGGAGRSASALGFGEDEGGYEADSLEGDESSGDDDSSSDDTEDF